MRSVPAIRGLALAALLAAFLSAAASGQPGAADFLQTRGQPPAEYVLSKLKDHRVVLLGENHWLRQDVQLVIDLVPRLRSAGVDALAIEMLPASSQPVIDHIVSSETWDATAALGVLRQAAWPYREYLEILYAAWRAKLKLIALGPGEDWRERLLPKGDDYDHFMARLVLDALKTPVTRVLVYSGLHHAFSRYHQPEMPRAERVEKFMDRMGNVLWRELGEDVFTIALAVPWQCRETGSEKWGRCLPVGGAIDCAASVPGHPVGFDVAGSPFAALPITRDFYYGLGYPALRLEDFADGYVWTRPVEEVQGVGLIPLSEFAPDAASLVEVLAHNPVSDRKDLGRAELEPLWTAEAERLQDLQKSFGWQRLAGWRTACHPKPADPP